ncbi:hypothetical protein FPQ18DRAFT_261537 [Pyronema domesticum]|nr:hypothetical protein FPQ18DRAFT_261537 [Pyronema domesticum]
MPSDTNPRITTGSALSPVNSIAGSEWSGYSKYTGTGFRASNGTISTISTTAPMGPAPGPGDMRGPGSMISPPSSVGRSSDGTALYQSAEGNQTLKNISIEERMAQHHAALSRWLRDFLEKHANMRQNRARDKLLRLSQIQFQELSTDVYDELQRREPGVVSPTMSPDEDTSNTPFLPPKADFHPKRNQARQKLSTLPADRFRDLATDVFYELERRFPRFSSGLLPNQYISPTNSMDGRGMPPMRTDSPGMQIPQRLNSPAPNGSMGPPSAPGYMNGRIPNGNQNGNINPDYTGPNGYNRRPPPGGPPGRPGPPGTPGTPRGPPGGPMTHGTPRDNPNSFGRPLPKTYQSNTIIPNKSTMVHKKLMKDYQAKVEILQDKVASLENSLEEANQKLRLAENADQKKDDILEHKRNEWDDLREQLEAKLNTAELLNSNLQSELDRVQSETIAYSSQLQSQAKELDALRRRSVAPSSGLIMNGNDDKDARYEELLKQHESLKEELKEQEEVTEEVRREAMEFLSQMKLLSERADSSFSREEDLNLQIRSLQQEITEWKSRYAKAKTTIRSIRSSSLGLQVPTSMGLFQGANGNLVDRNGLIKAVLLTKFQIAIDELLKVARGISFAMSLDQVKSVILATKALTQDLEDQLLSNPGVIGKPGSTEAITRLRSRISATANNLTTAAKNHAQGCGLSPVSLLDAAASHLTASVIELVKLVKIRPTQEGEEDDEEEYLNSATVIDDDTPVFSEPDKEGGWFTGGVVVPQGNGGVPGVSVARLSSGGESLYSPLSSPRESLDGKLETSNMGLRKGRDGSVMLGERVAAESKNWGRAQEGKPRMLFLESRTTSIVEAIHLLLESIKSDSTLPLISQHISSISVIISTILSSTEAAMVNPLLKERGEWIIANLSGCRDKMKMMEEREQKVEWNRRIPDKEFKSKLAGLAFDMARETKELVRCVEEVEGECRGAAGSPV